MIRAWAPGKVVLWGEYAVLEGAPAAVLAVDRYACCSLEDSDLWRFSTRGFKAADAEFDVLPATAPTAAAAHLPWHVLRDFPNAPPLALGLDSEAFYRSGTKLGLGSSAALCVALQAALAARHASPADFALALAAHRRIQGGKGSGIDVAASWHGGCLRFQNGNAQPQANPLRNFSFVWVGKPARTGAKLDRFAAYLAQGEQHALTALADCSERLFDNPGVDELYRYTEALKALDAAADLGIYTAPHRAAERFADTRGLFYKPCGAGGGDVGMMVSTTPEPIALSASEAAAAGLVLLPLKAALRGVRTEVASPSPTNRGKQSPTEPR